LKLQKKVIFVVGPNAVGKTGFSLKLAKEFDGEIVNADSMQIYRGMDIGTGKPSIEERLTCPHHLFDILGPSETFSVVEYKKLAIEKIEGIHARGKIPIVVGGTGLYVNALVNNLDFRTKGNLWEPRSRLFESCIIGLNYKERQKLYEKINLRVDAMMEAGLLEEVKRLFAEGLGKTAAQAIGYKEFTSFFEKMSSLEEVVTLIKKNSRKYAKRQLTWFCKLPNVRWVTID
jgi:tRNA dimethylallyltransferase